LGHRVRGLQIRSTTSHLCTCARVHVGTWVVSDCLTRGWEVQLLPPVGVALGADRLGTIDLPRADRLNEENTAFGPVWVQSHAIESRVSVIKSDRTVVPQKLLASFGFLSGTLHSVFLGG
jgi:hypothetical protein